MSDVIDIALGFDLRYAPHAGAALASIVRHAPDGAFRFICLHNGLPDHVRRKLQASAHDATFAWIEVRDEDVPPFAPRGHFNRAILFRLALERLAPPDCRRAIYLDSDIIACRDVRLLWAADLAGNALGAVVDRYQDGETFAERWGLPKAAANYFNSGVLLIDLARVRAEGLFSAAADFVARNGERILFGDQDALNWAFWGRWTELDPSWNVQRYVSATGPEDAKWRRNPPALVHFIGVEKPWTQNVWHPWSWLYWDNLARTPFEREVAAANGMGVYQLARLRLRWMLRRPKLRRAA